MFRRFFLLIVFSGLCAAAAHAQSPVMGKLVLVQDSRIAHLVAKHRYYGEGGKTEGYRVQIFYDSGTNSKNRAYAIKNQFMMMHPGVEAYLTFQSPNYKVRVGDFRTRMDAEGFKARISETFTAAFVVKSEINFPAL